MSEDDLENNADSADEIDSTEEGGGKSKKKLVMFVVIPLVLLLGGGAGAYFTGMFDSMVGGKTDCEAILESIENEDGMHGELAEDIPEECLATEEEESGADNAYSEPGAFLEIPNLIVNFNSTSGRPKFLKLSVHIEVPTEEDKKKLEEGMPRIIDHFQTYLRELHLEDMQGSSGLYRMRIELKSRVASAIPGVEVKDVLFQEILIQQ